MWKQSTRFCWVSIAFVTIAMAYVVSIARLYFPLLEQYRTVVEKWASEELNRPVKVSEISADWAGLQPRLRIKKVIVKTIENDRTWISFDEVQIYFRPLDSVQNWRLIPGKVNIVGADIDIEKRGAQYLIGGVKIGNKHGIGHSRLLKWLIGREKLIVTKGRVNWKDSRISHEVLKLRNIDLLLSFKQNDYHFSGDFRLNRQLESRFNFIVNLNGDFLNLDKMTRKVYFSGTAQIGNWLNKKLLANTDVKDGVVDFRLWANGIGGISSLFGSFDFEDVKWTRKAVLKKDGMFVNSIRPFEVEKLSANFNWNLNNTGWDLDIKDLAWTNKGQSWPASNIYLKYSDVNKIKTMTGSAQFFRLEDIGQLGLSLLPVNSNVRNKLKQLDPKGDIKNFIFEFKQNEKQLTDYYFKLDFERLALNSVINTPSIKDFRGKISANKLGGYLKLNTTKSLIHIHNLFDAAMPLSELRGNLIWQKTKSGLLVTSNKLIIRNKDANSVSRFLFKLNKSKSNFLDLKVNFSKGDKHPIGRYLPKKIMKQALVSWLESALIGGRAAGGLIEFKGDTDKFPFRAGEGKFSVKYDFKDIKFKFHELWPAIEKMHATLFFYSNAVNIRMHSGVISGMELLPTNLSLSSYKSNQVLSLEGSMIGDSRDLLNFIGQIPARNQKNSFLKKFAAKGGSLISLNLKLPLSDLSKRQYRGDLELFDSTFAHKNLNISLEKLDGFLSYENNGPYLHLNSKNLKGYYQQKQVTLNIKSESDLNAGVLNTRLEMNAKMPIALLLGNEAKEMGKLFPGESDWLVGFNIKQYEKQSPNVHFTLASELRGTTVNLPGMFSKIKNEEKKFLISADVSDNKLGAISLTYGKNLNAKVMLLTEDSNTVINRGEIRFGGGAAKLPDRGGLRLVGELDKFSISKWLDWSEKRKSLNSNSSGFLERVNYLNLRFNELEVVGNKVHHVRLIADRKVNHWQAAIDGHEIEGTLRIPLVVNKVDPLIIALSRLSLVDSETDKNRSVPDPKTLPPLKIHSNEFYYNGVKHGSLIISASKNDDGLKFDTFSINSKHLSITASGAWIYRDGLHRSIFTINAESKNIGKALARRDYGVNIHGGLAKININAYWKGPPSWFKLKIVNGTMDIDIKKGRILDIKTGGARLLGMFSLQALPRRLALDFRDVFKKGFSFDSIKGRFDISKGDAYTNTFVMDSPAAKVEIAGRLGLANQDYDQVIYVTPKISGNLAVVGGLAAGPTVGIGLWVADKLLGKKINRSITKRYSLEGTWTKPIVKKIKKEKAVNVDSDLNADDES